MPSKSPSTRKVSRHKIRNRAVPAETDSDVPATHSDESGTPGNQNLQVVINKKEITIKLNDDSYISSFHVIAGSQRTSRRPGSGGHPKKRRRQPRHADDSKRIRTESSDDYNSSESDGSYSEDSLLASEEKEDLTCRETLPSEFSDGGKLEISGVTSKLGAMTEAIKSVPNVVKEKQFNVNETNDDTSNLCGNIGQDNQDIPVEQALKSVLSVFKTESITPDVFETAYKSNISDNETQPIEKGTAIRSNEGREASQNSVVNIFEKPLCSPVTTVPISNQTDVALDSPLKSPMEKTLQECDLAVKEAGRAVCILAVDKKPTVDIWSNVVEGCVPDTGEVAEETSLGDELETPEVRVYSRSVAANKTSGLLPFRSPRLKVEEVYKISNLGSFDGESDSDTEKDVTEFVSAITDNVVSALNFRLDQSHGSFTVVGHSSMKPFQTKPSGNSFFQDNIVIAKKESVKKEEPIFSEGQQSKTLLHLVKPIDTFEIMQSKEEEPFETLNSRSEESQNINLETPMEGRSTLEIVQSTVEHPNETLAAESEESENVSLETPIEDTLEIVHSEEKSPRETLADESNKSQNTSLETPMEDTLEIVQSTVEHPNETLAAESEESENVSLETPMEDTLEIVHSEEKSPRETLAGESNKSQNTRLETPMEGTLEIVQAKVKHPSETLAAESEELQNTRLETPMEGTLEIVQAKVKHPSETLAAESEELQNTSLETPMEGTLEIVQAKVKHPSETLAAESEELQNTRLETPMEGTLEIVQAKVKHPSETLAAESEELQNTRLETPMQDTLEIVQAKEKHPNETLAAESEESQNVSLETPMEDTLEIVHSEEKSPRETLADESNKSQNTSLETPMEDTLEIVHSEEKSPRETLADESNKSQNTSLETPMKDTLEIVHSEEKSPRETLADESNKSQIQETPMEDTLEIVQAKEKHPSETLAAESEELQNTSLETPMEDQSQQEQPSEKLLFHEPKNIETKPEKDKSQSNQIKSNRECQYIETKELPVKIQDGTKLFEIHHAAEIHVVSPGEEKSDELSDEEKTQGLLTENKDLEELSEDLPDNDQKADRVVSSDNEVLPHEAALSEEQIQNKVKDQPDSGDSRTKSDNDNVTEVRKPGYQNGCETDTNRSSQSNIPDNNQDKVQDHLFSEETPTPSSPIKNIESDKRGALIHRFAVLDNKQSGIENTDTFDIRKGSSSSDSAKLDVSTSETNLPDLANDDAAQTFENNTTVKNNLEPMDSIAQLALETQGVLQYFHQVEPHPISKDLQQSIEQDKSRPVVVRHHQLVTPGGVPGSTDIDQYMNDLPCTQQISKTENPAQTQHSQVPILKDQEYSSCQVCPNLPVAIDSSDKSNITQNVEVHYSELTDNTELNSDSSTGVSIGNADIQDYSSCQDTSDYIKCNIPRLDLHELNNNVGSGDTVLNNETPGRGNLHEIILPSQLSTDGDQGNTPSQSIDDNQATDNGLIQQPILSTEKFGEISVQIGDQHSDSKDNVSFVSSPQIVDDRRDIMNVTDKSNNSGNVTHVVSEKDIYKTKPKRELTDSSIAVGDDSKCWNLRKKESEKMATGDDFGNTSVLSVNTDDEGYSTMLVSPPNVCEPSESEHSDSSAATVVHKGLFSADTAAAALNHRPSHDENFNTEDFVQVNGASGPLNTTSHGQNADISDQNSVFTFETSSPSSSQTNYRVGRDKTVKSSSSQSSVDDPTGSVGSFGSFRQSLAVYEREVSGEHDSALEDHNESHETPPSSPPGTPTPRMLSPVTGVNDQVVFHSSQGDLRYSQLFLERSHDELTDLQLGENGAGILDPGHSEIVHFKSPDRKRRTRKRKPLEERIEKMKDLTSSGVVEVDIGDILEASNMTWEDVDRIQEAEALERANCEESTEDQFNSECNGFGPENDSSVVPECLLTSSNETNNGIQHAQGQSSVNHMDTITPAEPTCQTQQHMNISQPGYTNSNASNELRAQNPDGQPTLSKDSDFPTLYNVSDPVSINIQYLSHTPSDVSDYGSRDSFDIVNFEQEPYCRKPFTGTDSNGNHDDFGLKLEDANFEDIEAKIAEMEQEQDHLIFGSDPQSSYVAVNSSDESMDGQASSPVVTEEPLTKTQSMPVLGSNQIVDIEDDIPVILRLQHDIPISSKDDSHIATEPKKLQESDSSDNRVKLPPKVSETFETVPVLNDKTIDQDSENQEGELADNQEGDFLGDVPVGQLRDKMGMAPFRQDPSVSDSAIGSDSTDVEISTLSNVLKLQQDKLPVTASGDKQVLQLESNVRVDILKESQGAKISDEREPSSIFSDSGNESDMGKVSELASPEDSTHAGKLPVSNNMSPTRYKTNDPDNTTCDHSDMAYIIPSEQTTVEAHVTPTNSEQLSNQPASDQSAIDGSQIVKTPKTVTFLDTQIVGFSVPSEPNFVPEPELPPQPNDIQLICESESVSNYNGETQYSTMEADVQMMGLQPLPKDHEVLSASSEPLQWQDKLGQSSLHIEIKPWKQALGPSDSDTVLQDQQVNDSSSKNNKSLTENMITITTDTNCTGKNDSLETELLKSKLVEEISLETETVVISKDYSKPSTEHYEVEEFDEATKSEGKVKSNITQQSNQGGEWPQWLSVQLVKEAQKRFSSEDLTANDSVSSVSDMDDHGEELASDISQERVLLNNQMIPGAETINVDSVTLVPSASETDIMGSKEDLYLNLLPSYRDLPLHETDNFVSSESNSQKEAPKDSRYQDKKPKESRSGQDISYNEDGILSDNEEPLANWSELLKRHPSALELCADSLSGEASDIIKAIDSQLPDTDQETLCHQIAALQEHIYKNVDDLRDAWWKRPALLHKSLSMSDVSLDEPVSSAKLEERRAYSADNIWQVEKTYNRVLSADSITYVFMDRAVSVNHITDDDDTKGEKTKPKHKSYPLDVGSGKEEEQSPKPLDRTYSADHVYPGKQPSQDPSDSSASTEGLAYHKDHKCSNSASEYSVFAPSTGSDSVFTSREPTPARTRLTEGMEGIEEFKKSERGRYDSESGVTGSPDRSKKSVSWSDLTLYGSTSMEKIQARDMDMKTGDDVIPPPIDETEERMNSPRLPRKEMSSEGEPDENSVRSRSLSPFFAKEAKQESRKRKPKLRQRSRSWDSVEYLDVAVHLSDEDNLKPSKKPKLQEIGIQTDDIDAILNQDILNDTEKHIPLDSTDIGDMQVQPTRPDVNNIVCEDDEADFSDSDSRSQGSQTDLKDLLARALKTVKRGYSEDDEENISVTEDDILDLDNEPTDAEKRFPDALSIEGSPDRDESVHMASTLCISHQDIAKDNSDIISISVSKTGAIACEIQPYNYTFIQLPHGSVLDDQKEVTQDVGFDQGQPGRLGTDTISSKCEEMSGDKQNYLSMEGRLTSDIDRSLQYESYAPIYNHSIHHNKMPVEAAVQTDEYLSQSRAQSHPVLPDMSSMEARSASMATSLSGSFSDIGFIQNNIPGLVEKPVQSIQIWKSDIDVQSEGSDMSHAMPILGAAVATQTFADNDEDQFGLHRTIETQTYPELRGIETQTNQGLNIASVNTVDSQMKQQVPMLYPGENTEFHIEQNQTEGGLGQQDIKPQDLPVLNEVPKQAKTGETNTAISLKGKDDDLCPIDEDDSSTDTENLLDSENLEDLKGIDSSSDALLEDIIEEQAIDAEVLQEEKTVHANLLRRTDSNNDKGELLSLSTEEEIKLPSAKIRGSIELYPSEHTDSTVSSNKQLTSRTDKGTVQVSPKPGDQGGLDVTDWIENGTTTKVNGVKMAASSENINIQVQDFSSEISRITSSIGTGNNSIFAQGYDGSKRDESTDTDMSDELERLRRERQRILDMLGKDAIPSKLQVELAEAQLNYYIGQTDTLLQALDHPWSADMRSTLSKVNPTQQELNRMQLQMQANFKAALEESQKRIEMRIREIELHKEKQERSRTNTRINSKYQRLSAIDAFILEREREQAEYERMKEIPRSMSNSPPRGSTLSPRSMSSPVSRTMPRLSPRMSPLPTCSSPTSDKGPDVPTAPLCALYYTPKQRKEFLARLRQGVIHSTKKGERPRSTSPSSSTSTRHSRSGSPTPSHTQSCDFDHYHWPAGIGGAVPGGPYSMGAAALVDIYGSPPGEGYSLETRSMDSFQHGDWKMDRHFYNDR